MMEKDFKIVLIGTPNCGKTTLFNLLTQSGEAVGNRIGVTFSPKEESMKKIRNFSAKIIDLPGVYSLRSEKNEEKVATNFLQNEKYDCIFNIADATNLERSLPLTLQLLSLEKPTVLLLNMIDEAEKEGLQIQKERLEKALGIPVFFISAAKKRGISELFTQCEKFFKPPKKKFSVTDSKSLHRKAADLADFVSSQKKPSNTFTDRIDRWICRPYVGVPLFFLVIYAVFFLTFSGVGDFFTKLLEKGFASLLGLCYEALIALGVSNTFSHFLVNGVFRGITSVLAFLPQTAILFFLITVLEDSGYLSRAAFVMDTTLRPLGLSGKAFIPFLVGFGCTVPAIMSTVTLEEKERESVIFALPFIPCNARLPTLILIINVFFQKNRALIAFYIYCICIATAIFSTWLSNRKNKEAPPLCLELPKFRMPNMFNVTREIKQKLKEFLVRAGTVVFLSCLIVDFLGTFTPTFQIAASGNESILAKCGAFLVPLFKPIGIADGRLIAALAAGFFAKEAIVSSIEITIPEGISSVMNHAQALSFLCFSFLYAPCMATVCAMRRECGVQKTIHSLLRCFLIAYWLAFIVYWSFRVIFIHFS